MKKQPQIILLEIAFEISPRTLEASVVILHEGQSRSSGSAKRPLSETPS